MTNNIILQFLNSPLQVLVVAQTVSAPQSRLARTASASTPASSVPVARTRTAMSQTISQNASMVSDVEYIICNTLLPFSLALFCQELFTQPCTNADNFHLSQRHSVTTVALNATSPMQQTKKTCNKQRNKCNKQRNKCNKQRNKCNNWRSQCYTDTVFNAM